jgi:hypothetical protein
MQAVVYANNISPRVHYIFTTLLKALGLADFKFTSDLNSYQKHTALKINYSTSRICKEEFWIVPIPILFQTRN